MARSACGSAIALCVLIVSLTKSLADEAQSPQMDLDSRYQFLHLDLDADDVLTEEEVTVEFLSALRYHRSDDSKAAFGEMDLSKDSLVDMEEFLAFTSPRVEALYATQDFENADQDGDGYLKEHEYANTGHAHHKIRPDDQSLKEHQAERYASLDVDADGQVSQAEFIASQGRDSFSDMDKNEDNQVHLGEWNEYWGEGEGAGDEEIFKLLDADGGGFITRTEYKHMSDLYKEEGFEEIFDENDSQTDDL